MEYLVETKRVSIKEQIFTVSNRTPAFSEEEREKVWEGHAERELFIRFQPYSEA